MVIEGTVKYRSNSCVLEFCKDFGAYYYALIPKYKNAQRQKYLAHVTIVREFEKPNDWFRFKLFEDERFSIDYSPNICYKFPYYYLECQSPEIEMLRLFYGLSPYRINNCYHITIGNVKNDPNYSNAYQKGPSVPT